LSGIRRSKICTFDFVEAACPVATNSLQGLMARHIMSSSCPLKYVWLEGVKVAWWGKGAEGMGLGRMGEERGERGTGQNKDKKERRECNVRESARYEIVCEKEKS
jgi:hypothetical protein